MVQRSRPSTRPLARPVTGIAALGAAIALAAAPILAFDAGDVSISAPNASPSLQRSLETSSLVRQAVEDGRTDPNEVLAAARADYRQLLGILYGAGHYGPTISVKVDGREAADIPPLAAPSRIGAVTIEVDPGPAFRFSRAQVTPLAPGTELPTGYAKGEIAATDAIRAAARAGVEGWRAAGHAKVDIAGQEIAADHAAETLSAQLTLAPGPQLRFGPLRVTGNKRVRTERVLAIAGLPEGEIYSPADIEKAATRLRRTEAFRSVTLADAETPIGDRLPIEATLLEEKRRRLGAGVELSSIEGLRLTAYWLHRNLLGGAERLRFDLDVENLGAPDDDNGVDYVLSAFFRKPAIAGPDYDLILKGRLAFEDEPEFTSRTIDLSAGVSRIFSEQLQGSIGVLYRAGEVEDAFGERDYSLLGLPIELTYDSRDAPLDATKGLFLSGLVQPFAGLNGIESGALLRIDGRSYRSFADRVTLAGRVQLGSLIGPDDDTAPPDYLFFAGGGGSVRGQPFQALGIGETDGTEVGGTSYLALSGEVRAQLRGPIGLVGFYDMGYVGAEDFPDGSGEWIAGAGIGLRYDTGFGPLRVDVGTPVRGGPDDAAKVQLYIGIGQAF